ncbi:hypothetical protein [cf. Phormidesmis sp. LEGE 11477]|uniref:hypothetical protein n=1 Tax=cf. Phormidesmis sp. LEGE 11477 TaxID=1828680 RepID=UPI001880C499|nr:hypothetical protein [cf. Phormidesmis sp. LEGE 11477]MBE9063670.1 hypothetical protein [cf. Phormidesmis sp. LEGE 11477]
MSNSNLRADGEGGYVIDYSDPDYVDTGEAYTSGEKVPDDPDVTVRVNFNTRTAKLETGGTSLDVSHNYFIDG